MEKRGGGGAVVLVVLVVLIFVAVVVIVVVVASVDACRCQLVIVIFARPCDVGEEAERSNCSVTKLML